MATLVSDIITQAFLDLCEIRVGRTIATIEQADAFLRLNQILGHWSAEQLSVYNIVHQGFVPTAGVTDYTVGTGGTLVTAARPVRITGATSISGTFRSPVPVLSFPDFHKRVANESGRSTVLATLLAADQGFPSINISIFPPPAAGPGTLWLDYWTAIAAFATVGDTVNMPPGFEKALHLDLALDLFPQYARAGVSPSFETLAAMAKEAKATITQLNAEILAGQAEAAK